MRGAAAARRRLLICQNRVGHLPPLPLPMVHPCIVLTYEGGKISKGIFFRPIIQNLPEGFAIIYLKIKIR